MRFGASFMRLLRASGPGLAGAIALVLMARSIIDHPPLYDELLHFLSAEGIRATGHPVIASGLYLRAELYTRLVAISMAAVGDSLVAARLPALLATVGLVLLLTLWIRHRAGAAAAWACAVGFCLLPATMELATLVRFYTLHALAISAMAIAVFEAVAPDQQPRRRFVMGACALLLVPLAWHLQSTTLVAIASLLCGAAAVLVVDKRLALLTFCRRHAVAAGLSVIFVAFAGIALALKLNLTERMNEVPLWAAWASNYPQYYLLHMANDLPLLWPVLPIAIAVGLVHHQRITLFCTITLLAGLVLHSLAAAKSPRYIYYLLPLVVLLLSVGFDGLLSIARVARSSQRTTGLRLVSIVSALGVLCLCLSSEGLRAAKLLLGTSGAKDTLSYAAEPDWRPIQDVLKPMAASAARVVTSNSMKAIYYFGRYDYELNASIVAETLSRDEFGVDARTGRQAVGTAESTEKILAMPGTTIIILEDRKLASPTGVPADALASIERLCTAIPLPKVAAVHSWRCQTS